MSTILIIDDEPGIRTVLRDVLEDEGYTVLAAEDGIAGLAEMSTATVDLVFLDVWLPHMGGIDVLAKLREEHPDVGVIMISGHANITLAVQAVKMGAFDFLEKPLSLDRTMTVVRNALALEDLRRENRSLRDSLFIEDRMIGSSPGMQKVRELIGQAAGSDSRILILGENGTGKELVAREVHRQSSRAAGPFVELNCAAIPENLIESELFGHEKGAFTSAVARRKGRFETAHGGTLFLDEIADMSLATQAKVLRVLQEMRFERIGGEEQIVVDVRVLAATNKDIMEQIRRGKFREDLYFRINVVPIIVPPLRERIEDLPELTSYFMGKFKRPSEKQPRTVSREAMKILSAYHWPGNIRELKNFVERVNIMAEEPEISATSVKAFLGAARRAGEDDALGAWTGMTLAEARDDFERQLIAARLRENGGNISRTAESLGLYASNLHSKMKKLKMRAEKTQTTMKGLTSRQREVFDFIRAFIHRNRYPPTIREIATNFRFSVKGSYDHVKALEKKGYIRCHEGRSRAIEVMRDAEGDPEALASVPLLGNVAAGKPLFAEENFQGHVQVPASSLGGGAHFALAVKGDSMRDAGIMDGDVVVVAHQSTADNGDIVVAMVDDAVTLKRFFVEKNRVRLKAENPRYPPIFTQNVRILGKLAFLMRSYP